MTEAHTVVLAAPKGPLVKLDDKHYKLVDKMDALTEAVPSLINATSLTVKGPVRFKAGTSFTGDVLIANGAPSEMRCACCIPDGGEEHCWGFCFGSQRARKLCLYAALMPA